MHVTNHFLDDLSVKPMPVDPLLLPEFSTAGMVADVLRLDRLHEVVSGNKIFKLKYHLQYALHNGYTLVKTFGGAWSNHIVATAFACREAGISCMGYIRGEEPKQWSATLQAAAGYGMKLVFLSRLDYDLASRNENGFSNPEYIIPSGGMGERGVMGSKEIVSEELKHTYTHLACSIGTGTMFTGLASSAGEKQTVIGIPAIKGFMHLERDYNVMLAKQPASKKLHIYPEYHFGGFAKYNSILITFMNRVFATSEIPTDIVYTGKLIFACADLAIRKILPEGCKLLIIHSGGLQGNASLPPGTLDF